MDPERMKAELAARHRPGTIASRIGGLARLKSLFGGAALPPQLRTMVEETLSANALSRLALVDRQRGTLGKLLETCSDADWRGMVTTLLPHVQGSAEAALRALERRPYQGDVGRKPFRCPTAPRGIADIRGRWLLSTAMLVGEYDADIVWIAEHAAQLAGWSGGADIGWLLAGAIDAGGADADRVYDILLASANGEHETGQMGRHVTQALMSCERPQAWEYVEKLLLAAQRQEGLRQAILESVDESHPDAFRRMLRVIADEKLARFSSVVRAADTWFGFMWDGASGVKIDSIIQRVLGFLDDPASARAALHDDDAETVYLALWSIAFADVNDAIAPAVSLLSSSAADVRFVATHLLVQTRWTPAFPPLVDMLGDPDLRVAARALDAFGADLTEIVDGERLFDRLQTLLGRVPKRAVKLDALVWPWWKRTLERPAIAAAMAINASAVPGERLLPHIPALDPRERAMFLRKAAGLASRWAPRGTKPKPRELTPAERVVALELLGDSSKEVREIAFQVMARLPLQNDEVLRLTELLGRKPGDLRALALKRLRALPDGRLLTTIDTLLTDPLDLRREAGLELLRDMTESGRAPADVRERADRYAREHGDLASQERTHVAAVLAEHNETATTDDGLGLLAGWQRPRWPEPRALSVETDSPAAQRSFESLARLVDDHARAEVATGDGETRLLLDAGIGMGPRRREDLDDGGANVRLGAVWKAWARDREARLRDADGLELLRALVAGGESATWKNAAVQKIIGVGNWSLGARTLAAIAEWCLVWEPPAGVPDFLLDALESMLASFTPAELAEIEGKSELGSQLFVAAMARKEPSYVKKVRGAEGLLNRLRWWRSLFPATLQPTHAARLYALLRWFQVRTRGAGTLRLGLDDVLAAVEAGAAGDNDVIDLLVGPWAHDRHSSLLRVMSTRKIPATLAARPPVIAVVDRCRRRIVEVETQRGDRITAASGLVMELRHTGGFDTLSRAVAALGKTHFARSFGWFETGASRQETLSHLVVRTVPGAEDTPEAFAHWARAARISEARLLELAVYAPQWAAHVNHVLQWPGLESAVWWIQAHTKDDRSWSLQEMKELWAAEVSERTPLSAVELTEGAVDVAWFGAVFGQLGPERWKKLDAVVKYAASSAGHTRAQLFARAMAGLTTRDDVLARIDGSRHQDSVRALGLLPLAQGDERSRDLLARYVRLEDFRREARKFGSQRQASEKRAAAIGLANLARTAGYRDAQRLQWAMEQRAVADLAHGPLVVERDGVTLRLAVDADGAPSLGISRGEKALKTLPAALKNDAEVAELKHRLQELRRQRSRVRDNFEEAMCRGDAFAPAELRTLLEHPILAPALARLVFVGDRIAGYLAEGGRVLRDHAGHDHVLGDREEVRIAHAYDLFARGDWPAWQQECFRTERVQPFKQIFRELYPITDSERGARSSRRYAGHQVNPRQALALLGARGWISRPEEGVSRTFHEAGLTARLGFLEPFFTPAEIEGLTLEVVVFTLKGTWDELPLERIPERVFSEAMRDLDLVVSVAHRGGVDPEATASTVEMRAALVRQTCELLGVHNVELQPHHAIVRGELGTYSVHLGSAGVLLLPGTALPIIPVHSQHRGRLFLPFADDDPKSAEVLSKVLLLARDREIRDPNILNWIRGARGLANA